ncbi:GntR family transcriptional regulator [Rhizobium sp. CCGE531]|uniref:GntR family transcriptional regulator n=1 Tax=Rhizobium sp. CCGE531 TaxID=2364271 RepID=UPI000EAA780A|nr:GntR family transcriptional regulator [Rhizobium sp. CCGE531]AYG66069.1 GntR family transcriptional regulator [Rhizobium sp. CCGE531]
MVQSRLRTSASLHESVREEILDRIRNGTYQSEAPIPSTAMLSEEFGVSPITVKRALRDLQAVGALTAVTGKGTFVKDHQRFLLDLEGWMSPFDNASIRLLSITREKIADTTLQVFNPPKEAMLCVRKMVYFGDDVPIVYDATYLSSDVDSDIVDEFGEQFVTNALERHDFKITGTSHIIDAAPAAGQAAEVFGVPNGYPMLRRLYKITTDKRNVTIFGVLQAPFDRLACSLNVPSNPKSKHQLKSKK